MLCHDIAASDEQMIPDEVLEAARISAIEMLKSNTWGGIHSGHFWKLHPGLPFGEDQARALSTYMRRQGTSSISLRLSRGHVIVPLVLIARNKVALDEAVEYFRTRYERRIMFEVLDVN